MRKVLTLAILGTALVASFRAEAQTTPAFIGATACEAAAPLRTEAMVARRAVSARTAGAVSARTAGAAAARRTERAAATRNAPRTTAHAERSVSRPAQTPVESRVDEAPNAAPEVAEDGPVLRRAVHFCVGTPDARRSWMT